MNKSKISKIKLYSTTTCPYCTMEADWLDAKGEKYEKVMVDQNQQEAIEMVRKTRQMGVPVTEIQYDDGKEEMIVGFDRNRLEEVLSA